MSENVELFRIVCVGDPSVILSQILSLMDRKRPQSFDDPFLSKESPNKKQNTFKTPQQTPQKPTHITQNKLPLGTPTVTTRYGITTADASSLVDRIDTFATLIKC